MDLTTLFWMGLSIIFIMGGVLEALTEMKEACSSCHGKMLQTDEIDWEMTAIKIGTDTFLGGVPTEAVYVMECGTCGCRSTVYVIDWYARFWGLVSVLFGLWLWP